MDEMLFVFLAAATAIFGVAIGAKVQKTCRFIVPWDFLTIAMIAMIAVNIIPEIVPDVWYQHIPIAWYWYVPFLIGYFAGYIVVGRTTYTMCIELPDPDHVRVCNRVFYEDSGKTYIQIQRNGALFDRLVFKIQHEVVTDTPLSDEKILSYDRPLFPKWEDRAVMIERIHTTTDTKTGWLLSHKVPTTFIDVAYGSCTSKMQLLYDIDVLEKMQRQIIDLTSDIHRLQSETGPKMLEHAMQLDMAAKRVTPANRALNLAKRLKECAADIPEIKKEEDPVARE